MLMPKKVKYRKQQKGRMKGIRTRGAALSFGEFGLQALGPAWLNSRQIEAARRAIVRYLRRGGKLWIRVFPDHPVTKRPAETRMGGGKGAVEYWAAVVKPGLISYDHYQFTTNGDSADYFLNLAMIRRAAQEAGLPFLNIVQACTWTPSILADALYFLALARIVS